MIGRNYLIKTWKDPRQIFRPSPLHGVGAFAGAPIRKGEMVEIIGGKAMTEEEFLAFLQTASQYNTIHIGEKLQLVEQPKVTKRLGSGSLNHSCDSNLWMADEITLVARHDIAQGEEVTVDYAVLVAFLPSDKASFITGASYLVDGGYTAQ